MYLAECLQVDNFDVVINIVINEFPYVSGDVFFDRLFK